MPNVLEAINTQIKLSEASPEIIKAVQQCLKIKSDGICGAQTMTAFHLFKKLHNLGEPDWLGSTTAKYLLKSSVQIISERQAETIFNKQVTTAQLTDLNNCLIRFSINTPPRLRHFISQVAHESCGLKYSQEIATGAAYENRRDLGNSQPGDGRRFKGAGFLQLTGRANYQALCNHLNDPRVMEGCAYVAATYPFTSAGHWWHKNRMNAFCDLGVSVEQVTRRVNGGLNGLADRQLYYAIALRVIK